MPTTSKSCRRATEDRDPVQGDWDRSCRTPGSSSLSPRRPSTFCATGTVEITIDRQPVTAEVTYAVISPGAEAPAGALFTVTAEPVTLEVPYRETIPVTGELREPDQIASGQIALRNPSDTRSRLPPATAFVDRNGVEYTFVNDVTIPAADDDGAGRAEAEVRAAAGGESANRRSACSADSSTTASTTATATSRSPAAPTASPVSFRRQTSTTSSPNANEQLPAAA